MRYGLSVAVVLVLLDGGAAEAGPVVDVAAYEPAVTFVPVLHRRRAISTYCYERSYWWFYRPYTTANDGHPRCMPYFHYPRQGQYGKEIRPYVRP